MADDAEDVLELKPSQVVDDDEADEDTGQTDGDAGEDDDGEELIIGFAGEEAAPASESESSVIRDLRRANRELAKRVHAQERESAPKVIEVGPKPSLESCEYDEERFETELDAWKDRQAQARRAEQEAEKRREADGREWDEFTQAYETRKREIGVPNLDEAEDEVVTSIGQQRFGLLLRTKKAPELVVALAKSPARLAELSKLNLADAALMIGELKATLHMEKRRKLPEPDRPITGNATPAGSTDKQLAKLEAEAERTGDRTKLLAYRRKLKSKAA